MPTTYPTPTDLEAKRAEGIIEPAKLPPETTIYIETTAQVYEFTTAIGDKLWASGAGKRPFSRQQIEFAGSIDQDGTLYAGMIVRGLHMIFKLKDGRYTTGCVNTASIRGKGYSYEMWENSAREPIDSNTGD